jgi:hypothetical protein
VIFADFSKKSFSTPTPVYNNYAETRRGIFVAGGRGGTAGQEKVDETSAVLRRSLSRRNGGKSSQYLTHFAARLR